MVAANRPPSPLSKAIRITVLCALGVVVFLLVLIPVLAFAVDLGGVVRQQIVNRLPQIEEQVGRPITLGQVKLHVLPSIEAEVDGLAIGPAAGATGPAAGPLMKIGSARLGIAVWPMLRSLGKEVRISRLEVAGLQVTVVREPGGKLSYEDILDHMDKTPQPPKPLTPEELQYLNGLELSRIALTGAALRFYDLEAGGPHAGAPLQIDQLDIVGTNVRLSEPFTVTLDAAVLAPQRNLHFAVTLGPFPADLQVQQPLYLLRRLELAVQPVQLGPVLRFLPARPGIGLATAMADADLKLTLPRAGGKLVVQGQAGLRGLMLRDVLPGGAQALGAPTDIRVKAEVEAEPLSGSLLAKSIELDVGDMGVSGSADVRSLWTTPAVHAITLSSKGLLLEKLLAILPGAVLPTGAVLRGPVVVHASGSGSPTQAKVEMGIDLTGATVLLPALHKPERTPLSAQFQGQLTGGGIDIERLGLVLGPLSLWLKGQVHGADFDLGLDTGKIDLDGMLRLLPTVVQSVPPGAHLGGALKVDGKFQRRGGTLNGDARIVLSGADARTPEFALTGEAVLSVKARSNGTAASIEGNLDLTPARILVPGSVDKAAGVAMRLVWGVEQSGQQITVRSGELALPGGVVRVQGQSDTAGTNMSLTVPLCDLDMQRLGQVVPALHRQLPGFFEGHLKFALAASGNPKQPGSMRAKLDHLELGLAGGRLAGGAEVVGLSEPKRVTFDLHGEGIDLDRLSGGGQAEKPAEKPVDRKSSEVPKFVRTMEMEGTFKLASARTHGATVRDLVVEVTMARGKAVLKVLRMGMFGGQVEASGTSVDFGPTPAKLTVRSKLQKIQVGELLALKSPALGEKLSGRGDLDLSVDGGGLSWEEIAPKLSGDLGLALLDGKLKGVSLGGQVVGPILQKVALLGGKDLGKKVNEIALDKLACAFQVRDGKLHTKAPMHLSTAEGSLTLAGAIGLDSSLALTGHLELLPQAIAAASGGKLVPTTPLPVDLRIGGTLHAPLFQVVNLQALVAGLAGSLLKGKAKDLLGNLPGGIGSGLSGALKPAAPGGAPVQQQVQQKVQQKAQQEQKKLEDEARKKLGDGLKGLF